MAKYINADDIEYTKKTFCYGHGWYELDEREETDVEFVLKKEIDEMPAADVVEVVRCGQCKFFQSSGCFIGIQGAQISSDNYCAWGQRKDG